MESGLHGPDAWSTRGPIGMSVLCISLLMPTKLMPEYKRAFPCAHACMPASKAEVMPAFTCNKVAVVKGEVYLIVLHCVIGYWYW